MAGRMTLDERVMSKVAAGEPGECWPWLDKIAADGYGRLGTFRDGKYIPVQAHRVVYRALVGEIPEGHVLHHRCENRWCVNPKHLEPLTPRAHALLHMGTEFACQAGHEWTPENTHIYKGLRKCRRCDRDRQRRNRGSKLVLAA